MPRAKLTNQRMHRTVDPTQFIYFGRAGRGYRAVDIREADEGILIRTPGALYSTTPRVCAKALYTVCCAHWSVLVHQRRDAHASGAATPGVRTCRRGIEPVLGVRLDTCPSLDIRALGARQDRTSGQAEAHRLHAM
jgi:hypothetical protein